MAQWIQCPGCAKRYALTRELHGKRVLCKACGQAFDVPLPAPPTALGDLSDFCAAEEDRSEEAVRRLLDWELTQVESRLAMLKGRVDTAAKSAEHAQSCAGALDALMPKSEPRASDDPIPTGAYLAVAFQFGLAGVLLMEGI